MIKNNKVKTIILSILMIFVLFGCSNNKTTETRQIDATTNITWDSSKDSIVVSTVTIKCNDNYYGVVVNDSINFNNDNNYFTTGEGLTISIKDNEEPIGNGTYNYKAKIEDNAYLLVSGNDEEKVKEVFNNVFKTNKESYQMFSHDISSDWTQNVVITSDVVSFFNGTDTTYIYQNNGSLSDGCLDGKIEPTVFKKQLRGIDIPITYPEDIDGVSNYIPYGTQTYDHWANEGYTPYSAYTLVTINIEKNVYNELNFTYSDVVTDDKENMTNFIILANNDNNVLNLFEDKNNHTQNLYTLKSSNNDNASTLNIENEDLSGVKDIASSVINSENRYHFGVIGNIDYLTIWSESNKDGYYVDGLTSSSGNVIGYMSGKLVAPTIKLSIPTYVNDEEIMERFYKYGRQGSDANKGEVFIDYFYAAYGDVTSNAGQSDNLHSNTHGATANYLDYLNDDASGFYYDLTKKVPNNWFMLNYYIFEGDYIYYYSSEDKLYIYKNIGTDVSSGEQEIKEDGTIIDDYKSKLFDQKFKTFLGLDEYDKETGYRTLLLSQTSSCFYGGINNLDQKYDMSTVINYGSVD